MHSFDLFFDSYYTFILLISLTTDMLKLSNISICTHIKGQCCFFAGPLFTLLSSPILDTGSSAVQTLVLLHVFILKPIFFLQLKSSNNVTSNVTARGQPYHVCLTSDGSEAFWLPPLAVAARQSGWRGGKAQWKLEEGGSDSRASANLLKTRKDSSY